MLITNLVRQLVEGMPTYLAYVLHPLLVVNLLKMPPHSRLLGKIVAADSAIVASLLILRDHSRMTSTINGGGYP